MPADDRFVPRFHMPLIGPPPEDYVGDPPAYYLDVAQQTTVAVTSIMTAPEQALPPAGTPQDKGLRVTITNPNAQFQYTPSGTANPPYTPPQWNTLFALMGGTLRYVSSSAPEGLNPFLPPPFDAIATPVSPPSATGQTAGAWGTLILTLWSADAAKMQAVMEAGPACGSLYYVGVAESSLTAALNPALKRLYPLTRFNAPQPFGRLPALRKVVEELKSAPYSTPPTYDTLIDDYLAIFLQGDTSLLVKGGAPIGQTVEVAGGSGALGQVEFWATDASASPAFADVSSFLWAGTAI